LSGRGNGGDLNVHITCMNESFLPFVVCVAEKLSEARVMTMVRFIGEKVIEWKYCVLLTTGRRSGHTQ